MKKLFLLFCLYTLYSPNHLLCMNARTELSTQYCSICDRQVLKNRWSEHNKNLHGAGSVRIQCPQCPNYYPRYTLNNHIKKMHNKKKDTSEQTSFTQISPSKPIPQWQCETCNQLFSKRNDWRTHQRKNHRRTRSTSEAYAEDDFEISGVPHKKQAIKPQDPELLQTFAEIKILAQLLDEYDTYKKKNGL